MTYDSRTLAYSKFDRDYFHANTCVHNENFPIHVIFLESLVKRHSYFLGYRNLRQHLRSQFPIHLNFVAYFCS